MGAEIGKAISRLIPDGYPLCPLHNHNHWHASMNEANPRRARHCNLNNVKKEISLIEKMEYIPGLSNVVGAFEVIYGVFKIAKVIVNLPFNYLENKSIEFCSGINHVGRGIIANIPFLGNRILYKYDSECLEHHLYNEFSNYIKEGKYLDAENMLTKYSKNRLKFENGHNGYDTLILEYAEKGNFAKAQELSVERSKYYSEGEDQIRASLQKIAKETIDTCVKKSKNFTRAKNAAMCIADEQTKKVYLRQIAISENAYRITLKKALLKELINYTHKK